MLKTLGRSVYLTQFEEQRASLSAFAAGGAPVFISLHISEEFDAAYCARVQEMCDFLAAQGWRILADVSEKTIRQFGCADLTALAKRLHLWGLRLDYGFSLEEMRALAQQLPVAVNASTTTPEVRGSWPRAAARSSPCTTSTPARRPALTRNSCTRAPPHCRQRLAGVRLYPRRRSAARPAVQGAAHAGSPPHRRPLGGLCGFGCELRAGRYFCGRSGGQRAGAGVHPALLHHRRALPAGRLRPGYETLYDRTFTCRPDSPKGLVRYQESRLYSCFGSTVQPDNCVERRRRCVTMDNIGYGAIPARSSLCAPTCPQTKR